MGNFGYPYNDIVICKDSTDYLFNFIDFLKSFSYKQNITTENMHSFYEIFPDHGDLGGLFFVGGREVDFLEN